MVIFFVLRTAQVVRYFEPTIKILAERGHTVHIGFPYKAKGGDHLAQWVQQYGVPIPGQQVPIADQAGIELLTRLANEHPTISWGYIRQRRSDGWQEFLNGLRACRDYLRYFDPAFRHAAALRERSVYQGVPSSFAALMEMRVMRTRFARWLLRGVLNACERATPVSVSAVDEILDIMPDVVLVSRLVDYGSRQVDYVRAAQYLGIPAGLPVASWDNLTNKGLMRVLPDFVTVWNEFQKTEAVELHGMSPDRVWVTGAQTFDVWFDRKPSVDRKTFCARFGFNPDNPLIVYLGSSRSIAGYEVDLVRRWLKAVRRHKDKRVRDAGIVIRPHPQHGEQWQGVDLSQFGDVVVWPKGGEVPLTESQRSSFFDTLYHSSAIVGLNTSAQIEAAIIGRPVLVLIDPEQQAAREGTLETLHFKYLSDPEHGIATVANNVKEHLAQLSTALSQNNEARGKSFVREFVRPHGLDEPAAPRLADAIERGVSMRTHPELGTNPLLLMLRGLLYLLRPALTAMFNRRIERKDAVDKKPWLKILGARGRALRQEQSQ